MTSDEKRRDVASKLRAEAESWRCYREDDSAFCMNDHEFTEAVLEDFGFDDAGMPAYEVFDQMADIVDRPTCKTIEHGGPDESHVCKSCSKCSYGWFECVHDKPYSFCPNCGARMVRTND